MTNGTGIAFDHALRVAEQEYLLAMQDDRLTRRHGLDLAAARVRASSDDALPDALKAIITEAQAWLEAVSP